MIKITRATADGHWWYRLIKVGYIIIVASAIAIIFYTVFDSRPKVDFYNSTFQVVCNNSGLKFGNIAGKSISYDYEKDSNQNYTILDENLSYVSYRICQSGHGPVNSETTSYLSDFDALRPQDIDKTTYDDSFKIVLSKKELSSTYTSFLEEIGWMVLLILIMIIAVPKIFKYVVFGKKQKEVVSE